MVVSHYLFKFFCTTSFKVLETRIGTSICHLTAVNSTLQLMLLVHVPASMGHKIWGQFSKTATCGSTCDILTPLYFGAFAGNVAYDNLWDGLERGGEVTQDTA